MEESLVTLCSNMVTVEYLLYLLYLLSMYPYPYNTDNNTPVSYLGPVVIRSHSSNKGDWTTEKDLLQITRFETTLIHTHL